MLKQNVNISVKKGYSSDRAKITGWLVAAVTIVGPLVVGVISNTSRDGFYYRSFSGSCYVRVFFCKVSPQEADEEHNDFRNRFRHQLQKEFFPTKLYDFPPPMLLLYWLPTHPQRVSSQSTLS